MRISATLVLPLLLLGCEAPTGKPALLKDATAGCSKFGESCEFSPGKLGTCVEKTDCPAGQSCLICQSQH